MSPRRAGLVAATALALASVVGLVLRHVPFHVQPWQAVAAFSLYLLLAAPLALLGFVLLRRRAVAAAAAVLTVLGIATQLPLFAGDAVPAAGSRLTVMTSNIRLGLGSAPAVVRAVDERRVDLLLLQEVTPASVERLTAAGLDARLPFHALAPAPAAAGVAIYSRRPLDAVRRPGGLTFRAVTAVLRAPGAPTVMTTHMAGPWPGPAARWARDIARLPEILGDLVRARPGAPLLVGGDFNATYDSVEFRDLLTGGLRDAAEQAGAGIVRTYPARAWYPPLIGIDHVLTRRAVATSVATVAIAGSDHRAVVSTVALP